MPNYVIFVGLEPPSVYSGDKTEFELPKEAELKALFNEYGNCSFVYTDLKKYNIRGGESRPRFGHVTYYAERDAKKVMESLQDHKFQNGVRLRLLMRPEEVYDWRSFDVNDW